MRLRCVCPPTVQLAACLLALAIRISMNICVIMCMCIMRALSLQLAERLLACAQALLPEGGVSGPGGAAMARAAAGVFAASAGVGSEGWALKVRRMQSALHQ